jgi:hypothetical protein
MGYNHIANCFEFHGTYGVYGVAKDGIEPMVCHAEISDGFWSDRDAKETKAYRRELMCKGKKVRALREDTLHDELFVIFGPKISVASAVKRLREVAKHIAKNGMLIGIDSRGEYVCERPDGSVGI